MSLALVLALALMQPQAQAPLGPLQKPNLETKPQNQRQIPAVTFTLNWPAASPQFVKIEVEPAGRAFYLSQRAPTAAQAGAQPAAQAKSAPRAARSQGAQQTTQAESGQSANAEPQGPQSESGAQQQPYIERFTFSPATRQKIFELAKAAHYFNGKFEYHGKVAQTGTKTLAYVDETRNFETSYNWSENAAIERLTQIFEGVSATVEAGRKLRELMRYDPLGLDEELGKIEQAADSGQMGEIGILKPMLEQITSDGHYMHVAQQRARRLLAMAER